MDESITFSVRTEGNTKVYDGSTLSDMSTWQFVMMLVSCDDFIPFGFNTPPLGA